MQFLSHFVFFDIPEWLLLENVDECDQLYIFLDSENGITSPTERYLWDFAYKFPMRKVFVNM